MKRYRRMQFRSPLPFAVVLALSLFQIDSGHLAAQCESGSCTGASVAASKSRHRLGRWFVVDTVNFRICCIESEVSATQLAESAEKLRSEFGSKWLGKDAIEPWKPRCQIVLHPNLQSYVSAAGRGSEHTIGCSLVNVSESRVTGRRIDLVGGRKDFLSAALPHELTHIVLKDRFTSTEIPRWADEGMAILADSQAKQGGHLKDLRTALMQSMTFPTAALVKIDEYPNPNRVGAFYGQSASTAKFLIDRKNPQQFVDFIERSILKGYDSALNDCYGIQGVADLEKQWRRSLNPIRLTSTGEHRRLSGAELSSNKFGR